MKTRTARRSLWLGLTIVGTTIVGVTIATSTLVEAVVSIAIMTGMSLLIIGAANWN